MKKILAAAVLAICATQGFAAELFPDAKPAPYTPGDLLPDFSTMGGYALYQGGENWRLMELNSRRTGAFGDAEAITLGIVGLQQNTPAGQWLASMYVVANLTGAGLSQYMGGSPCAGAHLVALDKGRRQDDNCLTVDAERSPGGANPTTMLVLRITHAKSAGRVYRTSLYINLMPMGLGNTRLSDWTPAAVQAVPERAALVQRLQKWAESMQDASERALDFKKPQDAFAGIPALRTLLPIQPELVPEPLAEGSFPKDFLEAAAQTLSRPGFRALAYTQVAGQFRWQSRNGMADQASANEQALESCESGRPKSAPACKLLGLEAAAQ